MKLADGRELLTANEAAELLGVTPGRVFHFMADGRLTFVRLEEFKRRRFLVAADVRNLVKKRRVDPRSKRKVRKESFKVPW